jgi:succinyl-CoA synthetase beta subunit
VRRLLAGPPGPRSEAVSKQALAAYGVRPTRDTLATSAAEAVRAARALGGRCVLKVAAAGIPHKSDLGLVRVGVAPSEVRAAYDELARRARRVAPRVEIDGVLVSELVDDGVEMLAGISTDPLFGPVVSVGLGGVFVEVLGDVAVRVPPFDEDEAHRMLRELRGFPLLTGARGRPPADLDALVGVLVDLQRFALDLADVVAEVDVNPLVVRRRGARALDALVVCR